MPFLGEKASQGSYPDGIGILIKVSHSPSNPVSAERQGVPYRAFSLVLSEELLFDTQPLPKDLSPAVMME
jgi:hypothetical protein